MSGFVVEATFCSTGTETEARTLKCSLCFANTCLSTRYLDRTVKMVGVSAPGSLLGYRPSALSIPNTCPFFNRLFTT